MTTRKQLLLMFFRFWDRNLKNIEMCKNPRRGFLSLLLFDFLFSGYCLLLLVPTKLSNSCNGSPERVLRLTAEKAIALSI